MNETKLHISILRIDRRALGRAAAVFLALAAACAHAQESEDPVVRAEGRAEGTGFAARERAVREAERQVVEQVLRTMIAGGELSTYRPILENANRYIGHYDVLRHDTLDTTTRVEIDATVSVVPLRSDVSALALPLMAAPPAVLLVIGEQVGADRVVAVPDYGVAENTLAERLDRLGVKTSRSVTLNALFKHAQLVEAVNGGREAASTFAQKQTEDVVVIGRALTSSEGPSEAGIRRHRAEVSIAVYRSSDGKLLDDFASSAAVYGADPAVCGTQAVEDAAFKLVGDLAISATLAVLQRGSSPVFRITLHGAQDAACAEAVIARLKSLPAARDIVAMVYNPKLTRIRLFYDAPLASLVRGLEGLACNGKTFDVTRAVAREIEARFGDAP